MENSIYEKLKVYFIQAAWEVNSCREEKDVNRNHVNYGIATAYANVLRQFGHEIGIECWDDGGYLKLEKVTFDGKVINI